VAEHDGVANIGWSERFQGETHQEPIVPIQYQNVSKDNREEEDELHQQ